MVINTFIHFACRPRDVTSHPGPRLTADALADHTGRAGHRADDVRGTDFQLLLQHLQAAVTAEVGYVTIWTRGMEPRSEATWTCGDRKRRVSRTTHQRGSLATNRAVPKLNGSEY